METYYYVLLGYAAVYVLATYLYRKFRNRLSTSLRKEPETV